MGEDEAGIVANIPDVKINKNRRKKTNTEGEYLSHELWTSLDSMNPFLCCEPAVEAFPLHSSFFCFVLFLMC